MNQKNLNYEIETIILLLPRDTQQVTMNQKNLNYEIETIILLLPRDTQQVTMNQKNLNYEIETCNDRNCRVIANASYERQESQL